MHGGGGGGGWQKYLECLPNITQPPSLVGIHFISHPPPPPSPWTNLTLEQYYGIEEQCDKRNASSISHVVARRVDGAPRMGDHMKATTAIEPPESFFWNKEYFERFYKIQSLAAKKETPGYFYVFKIIAFDEFHKIIYRSREFYREFFKGDCENKTGELCDWCIKAHGHTLLITKKVSATIQMYSRHQCVMTVESHRDQMIFNPESILGNWSKRKAQSY